MNPDSAARSDAIRFLICVKAAQGRAWHCVHAPPQRIISMIGYVEAPVAWGLVRGMARRAGLDVPRAVLEGWLTRADLARIVDKCQSGNCSKSCMALLAKPSCSPQSPPAFCAIKAELDALAPQTADH
jgi:hypothetical protein